MFEVFCFLGFYDMQPDTSFVKASDSYTFPYNNFTATELGNKLVPVLLEQRPFELWNEPSDDAPDFDFILDFLDDSQKETTEEDVQERPDEAFIETFKPLLEQGELKQSISPNLEEKEETRGVYTIKYHLQTRYTELLP